MLTTTSPFVRAFVAAALVGGLALATPSYAAQQASPSGMQMGSSMQGTPVASKKGASQEDPAQRIETRIQTLHDKLQITPDQESEWKDVAQAMRDSEFGVTAAIQNRQQNASSMNAVDDLQSYEKIVQAHADGIQKVASSFQPLYDDMSDSQKKNADEVFGRFEGHRGVNKASAMKKKGSTAAPMSDE